MIPRFQCWLAGNNCMCPSCSYKREPRTAKQQTAAALWRALFWWAA